MITYPLPNSDAASLSRESVALPKQMRKYIKLVIHLLNVCFSHINGSSSPYSYLFHDTIC